MVIVMLGPDAAGYYTNFLSLRQILMLLITPIMALLFPLFAEMIEKKEIKKISMLQNILYTYLTIFTLSMSFLLVVL
jgi:O-antigen/teichoic acid export membrane protein